MSRRPELTADQRTILAHLSRLAPAPCDTEDLGRHTGLDLASVLPALDALLQLGYVTSGLVVRDGYAETIEYMATAAGRRRLRRETRRRL